MSARKRYIVHYMCGRVREGCDGGMVGMLYVFLMKESMLACKRYIVHVYICKGCDGGYVGMWTHCAESGSFPSMLR